ncbi:MAG TPA: AAA family ATPase [Vicinamibacterales bacterium]|nr:AAA family ATPase [Vicinamibacterales bacterium]
MSELPRWASEMRDLFRSGSAAQFLIHGNVFDVIPYGGRLLSLPAFLDEVMFGSYDVVLRYDRSRGVRATRGAEDWGAWLDQALGREGNLQTLLREPGSALELIDRYVLRSLNVASLAGRLKPASTEGGAAGRLKPASTEGGAAGRLKPASTEPGDVDTAVGAGFSRPTRIAVVIEFAEFVVPRGDALQLGGPFAANIVKVLGWANDPAITQANVVTVLVSEGLRDLNDLVVDNPHAAALHVPLPDETEMSAYVHVLATTQFPELPAKSEVPFDTLGARLTGLSRVGARSAIGLALRNDKAITSAWLTQIKKDLIERECQGLLEFIESPFTLDNVAGHDAVKAWLREDAALLRRGALRALPMGYLIAGRIGTGKTFLVQCWAGEIGIPCVVLKNFRDRWVGATESNLEKIFAVLRAVGQVVVFVDEADQAAGRRGGGGDDDSGLSGRVYSMLAKEMSETRNRGRIIWVFATSRPDLLEVDLKRQGRLDVHIPLFPPETAQEREALLLAIARKLKFPLTAGDLPPFADDQALGGNELEGVLVRALRLHELSEEPRRPIREILADVLREVRPSPHTRKLEFMDLVAVKECTDARFLPERFRELTPEELETRIDALRRFV